MLPMTRRGLSLLCLVRIATAMVVSLPSAGQDRSDASTPGVEGPRFHPVQDEVGLVFRHDHGGSGRHYMFESVGAGVAALDYDRDGWLDVYAVQSAALPGRDAPLAQPRNVLFRNHGDGHFAKLLDTPLGSFPGALAADESYGNGVTAGDYDGDGFVDLYVANWGPNALYRNNGDGTFSDVTLVTAVADDRWGTSATWTDVNGDGLLDLFVINYLDATIDNHRPCRYGPEEIESYCGPRMFEGTGDVLYINRGDGTFLDNSVAAGVVNAEEGKGLAVHALDDDGDGDIDLFVANDTRRNFLYRNDGSGHFEDMGLLLGVGYNAAGRAQADMGIEWTDLNGDLLPDLLVTHFQDDYNTFFRNVGDFYVDQTGAAGLRGSTLDYLAFGVVAFDPDLDGDLDVYFANGHIFDFGERYGHAQLNQLFLNNGSGRFEDVGEQAGPGLQSRKVSRGAAAADLDNDGDPDLLVSNNHDDLELLANGAYGGRESDAVPPVVTVVLAGRESPRGGSGAHLKCSIGDRTIVRYGRTASSYLSQGDHRLTCASAGEPVVSVTVRWPSGTIDELGEIPVGTQIVVTEGRGISASGRLGG